MKFKKAFLASALFVLILAAIYYIHVQYFNVDVVFYAAIFDGILSAIITTVLLFLLPIFRVFNNFEKFQLSLLWVVVAYALAISVPTVIDRSLSFYILEKLAQRGGTIRESSFEDVFTKEYMKEHRLVDVRLTEQEQSGTITITNNCVALTEKGAFIASMSRAFRQHLLPKHRLLMGTYTDALTDPFRQSAVSPDYACKP